MATVRKDADRILAAHTMVVRALEQLIATGAHGRAAGVHLDRALLPVLNSVAERGTARIGDVALDIGLDASTVSRHVSQLRTRGLLERVQDETDRRAASVSLTEEGQAVQARVRSGWDELLAAALVGIDRTTRTQLVDSLGRFAESLTAIAAASAVVAPGAPEPRA